MMYIGQHSLFNVSQSVWFRLSEWNQLTTAQCKSYSLGVVCSKQASR